jgi:hypothetical protein
MIDVHAVGCHRDDAAPASALEDPGTPPRKGRRARHTPDAEPIKEKLHTTCQFRHAQAMVYELKADRRQIEVRIQAAKSGGTGWDVALVVKGDAGPTRVEAMTTGLRVREARAHLRHARVLMLFVMDFRVGVHGRVICSIGRRLAGRLDATRRAFG